MLEGLWVVVVLVVPLLVASPVLAGWVLLVLAAGQVVAGVWRSSVLDLVAAAAIGR